MEARTSGSPLLPKPIDQFRDYANARPRVEEFYALNHAHQTLDFVLGKKREYLRSDRKVMTVWESLDYLNTLVDDSDPDIDFTQIEHALQTAEAIRAANQPRWFIVTGLIHDLGKILCLFGEPQWAVVGDTFPVGCRFSPKIVYSDFFKDNPDSRVPEYQTESASTSRAAASTTCTCRGDTTSTSTTSSRTTCRRKRSTCCAITRSTRGTRKASTRTSRTRPIARC